MKQAHINIISALIAIAMVFTIIGFTRIELHGAVSNPLLYYNDRAWSKEDRKPIEKLHSLNYVPVTIFAQLKGVEVLINENMYTITITNGDYWLAINTLHSRATTQLENSQEYMTIYFKTSKLHDDHYVPAQAVCEYLHLGYTELVSTITGETAIRITDGSQQRSFEELLANKYPSFFETEPPTTVTSPPQVTETTTAPPVTSRPSTDTTIPAPTLTDRTIYITIEDAPGEYTEDILRVLDEYGCAATFFIIGDRMVDQANTLSQIAARGHTIGLHTMSHDPDVLTDAAVILADIEQQNELLSRVIRQKSHIWRAPEGSKSLRSLTAEVRLELSQNGYLIWDANIDVPANARTAKAAATTAINGIWNNEVAILRFCEGKYTAEALALVLEFIEENSDVCEIRTISPAYYEYNLVG